MKFKNTPVMIPEGERDIVADLVAVECGLSASQRKLVRVLLDYLPDRKPSMTEITTRMRCTRQRVNYLWHRLLEKGVLNIGKPKINVTKDE